MWRSVKGYFASVSMDSIENIKIEDPQPPPEPTRELRRRTLPLPTQSAPVVPRTRSVTSHSITARHSTMSSALPVEVGSTSSEDEDEENEDAPASRKRKGSISVASKLRKRTRRGTDKYSTYLGENRKVDDKVYDPRCDNCTRSDVICVGPAMRSRCHYCTMSKRGCTFHGHNKSRRIRRAASGSKGVAKEEEGGGQEMEDRGEEGSEEEREKESEDEGGKVADEDAPSPGVRAPTNTSASATRNLRRKARPPVSSVSAISQEDPGVNPDKFEVPERYTAVLDPKNKTGRRRLQLVSVQNQIAALEADIDMRCTQLVFLYDLAAALSKDDPEEAETVISAFSSSSGSSTTVEQLG